MNSDPLDTGSLASCFHVMGEAVFGHRKDPVRSLNVIVQLQAILHLLTQEIRNRDQAHTGICLRCCNDIPALKSLIGFIDSKCFLLEIKILRRKCQQFAFPDPRPVKDLKGVIIDRLLHHDIRKLQIFFFRPEIHFPELFFAETAGDPGRIDGKLIIADRMIEHGGKLCMNRLHKGRRKRFPILSLKLHDRILPVHDILRRNLRKLTLAEIRKDFPLDDALLRDPGILFQPGFDILLIKTVKAFQRHIDIRPLLKLELGLPGQGIAFRLKSSLALLLLLTAPVRVPDHQIPGTVFILICRHLLPPFLPLLCFHRSFRRNNCDPLALE